MASFRTSPAKKISGTVGVPPDKSISHRAVLLAALAQGDSVVENYLASADCLATVRALRDLGIEIDELGGNCYRVHGKGLGSLRSPARVLDLGNSGTGIRLLTGVIAGQPITATLTGDESLCKRPMRRVIEPLCLMGAKIEAQSGALAPLIIHGSNLKGIEYGTSVSSAQVKSAILLAGLQAQGTTKIQQPFPSRDHTERLIKYMGGHVTTAIHNYEVSAPLTMEISGPQILRGQNIRIPGDASSAAFLIAAALLVKDSDLVIENAGLNPSRTAFLELLVGMGANIQIKRCKEESFEPVGAIRVQYSELEGRNLLDPRPIPNIIDEIPIIAVLAAKAHGVTEIRHAGELRVKESDRIKAICENLKAIGARVEEYDDGFKVEGPAEFRSAAIDTHKDHRIAMAFAVAGLCAQGPLEISDVEFIDTSFPGFFDLLSKIAQ